MSSASADSRTYVDVRAAIRLGWNRGATHFLQFALVLIAMLAAIGVFALLAGLVRNGVPHLLIVLMEVIAPLVLSFGLWRLALPIADGEPVTWRTAWSLNRLDAYTVAVLVITIPFVVFSAFTVGVAFVLGAPLLCLFPYFILDREMDWWPALKRAWITAGIHYGAMFKLCLILIGLNLLGFIVLIGWFITIPMSVVAIAHAYRTATGPPGPRTY